jgi:hypothetical protein
MPVETAEAATEYRPELNHAEVVRVLDARGDQISAWAGSILRRCTETNEGCFSWDIPQRTVATRAAFHVDNGGPFGSKTTKPRRVVLFALLGRAALDTAWYRTCRNRNCMNPGHAVSEVQRKVARPKATKTSADAQKIAHLTRAFIVMAADLQRIGVDPVRLLGQGE